jgi:alkanesulfonate monooxygenase SsuD/methylene tetrahydromethanopterin reductase-like flavin-dependent oxidoreductase (luciferase family)
LLDHNIPRQVSSFFGGLEVVTARSQRWDALRNGDLIKVAELAGFDVMLTADHGIL